MRKPRRNGYGESMAKLNALGIDWFVDQLLEGKSTRDIAALAEVSIGSLIKWEFQDPERSTRVNKARAWLANMWQEKGEEVLRAAKDKHEYLVARELACHYRWRSSKVAPKEWGTKVEVNTVADGVELTDAQRAALDKVIDV